ncbi:MAG: D-aminoacyl-tRNA deacylase [Deinococcota bacterium]
MRALVQRVREAHVEVDGEVVGAISQGVLVLLGIGHSDDAEVAQALAQKLVKLRIFSDDAGKMNLSVRDVGGSALVVSQFTLFADAKKGNRPSYTQAAPPDQASSLYETFCEAVDKLGVPVAKGRFAADMQVHLINDGPVTLWLDSDVLLSREIKS